MVLRTLAVLIALVLGMFAGAPLAAQDDAAHVFVYDAWLLTEDGLNGTVYATLDNRSAADLTLTSVTSPDGAVMLTPMDAAPPMILAGEALILTPDTLGLYVSSSSDEPTLDDGVTLTLTFADADGHTQAVTTGALPVDAPPEVQPIVVLAGWARPTAVDPDSASDPASVISGAYLTLENQGDEDDALVSVSSPRISAVEIHETQMDDGVMRMRPMAALPLAAGEQHALAPGGEHLMLIGLERHLLPGDVVPLTLTFDSGLEVTVAVPVRDEREPDADMDMQDMESMDHSDMDMGNDDMTGMDGHGDH